MPALSLLALSALAQAQTAPPARIVEPTIARVSMFKNGYSFVTRVIPATDGKADVVEIPQASLGTLWFYTDDGSAIESIETASDLKRTVEKSDIGDIPTLLRANVGRQVGLTIRYPGLVESKGVNGKIVSVSGGLVNLEIALGGGRDGEAVPTARVAYRLDAIVEVASTDPLFTFQTTSASEQARRFYRIRKAKPGGNVIMMSLEKGLTWAPAYALDLTDPKKLTLVARSTILNDVYDLKAVGARLITGFPNLPYRSLLDPISANLTVDQWIGMIGGAETSPKMANRRGESMMTQNAYAPGMNLDADFSGVPEAAGQGEGIGDLFFYDLPALTLPKGARQSRNLFRFESPYEHLYTWDLEPEYDVNSAVIRPIPKENDEVWHTIEFRNTSTQPLTTAVATILEKNELTGQTMLSYIPAGAKAEARINKALDITPERLEEETARERGAIKDRFNNPTFDLLTIKGTLKLTNRKREAVKVRVCKELVGEVTESSDGGVASRTPGGLGQTNPQGKVVWNLTIPAGESKTVTYGYKVYVRSQ